MAHLRFQPCRRQALLNYHQKPQFVQGLTLRTLPSLITSYRTISLISSIMKLFESVIEQRLRSHLEHIGFIDKHQSGFRKAKSTDDRLFRLSQSIMESFNRGEHVVAAFLDVVKAFDNVWHNRLRFKISSQTFSLK